MALNTAGCLCFFLPPCKPDSQESSKAGEYRDWDLKKVLKHPISKAVSALGLLSPSASEVRAAAWDLLWYPVLCQSEVGKELAHNLLQLGDSPTFPPFTASLRAVLSPSTPCTRGFCPQSIAQADSSSHTHCSESIAFPGLLSSRAAGNKEGPEGAQGIQLQPGFPHPRSSLPPIQAKYLLRR